MRADPNIMGIEWEAAGALAGLLLDPDGIAERTRGMMPVHLDESPGDMDAIWTVAERVL